MELVKKNSDLIAKWKKERPEYDHFAVDGILNYSTFEKQIPKIMFLLKEPNDNFVKIAPIEENSKGYGPKGNSNLFWRFMRGYEHVITIAWNNHKYSENEIRSKSQTPNINTAYVNVKKQCDNNRSSKNKEIESFAEKDKELLIEQIELINPNIIYCAGTFSSYKILDREVKIIAPRVYESEKRIVIDFYHLAHRKGYKTFKELHNLVSKVDYEKYRNKKKTNHNN